MPNASRRVVILGGGPAGVAAAFWLTAPEQNNRYQVTLYTQGWRLGGKCASGRNQSEGDRIEEHGLHMLMGCYQNAFATLRACYDAWTPPPGSPISKWTDAFLPQRQVTLMETDGPGGSWAPWNFANLPKTSGEPGDGYGAGKVAAAAPAAPMHALILKLADWLEQSVGAQRLIAGGADAIAVLRAPLVSVEDVTKHKLALLQTANQQLSAAIQDNTTARQAAPLARPDSTLSRLLILANLGFAIGYGYLRDIALRGEGAYDKLDALDFRAWLNTCEAFSETLASAPLRALYDLMFAYPGGMAGSDAGSVAAGATFRFLMELTFGYRNAPLWKMAAGTGDTVFAPLYQVLEARQPGCVKFYSRFADMHAGTDGRIQSIDISIQAVTTNGAPYNPLVSVQKLQCWPNQPDWSQLQNGSVLQKDKVDFESSFCTVSVGVQTLKADQDFDLVILAIPPMSILQTPASFAQNNTAWQTALQASSSVATQSLQLWMSTTVEQLGWTLGATVLSAYAEDYDSWGDMSHLLPVENWSGPNPPRAIGYFVGCLPLPQQPPPSPGSMPPVATKLADQWMAQSLATLWPAYAPSKVVSRYDVANFDGSELYVQTPGGANVASRLSPAATAGFSNLYVIGDWTRTRFSGGCFESAVESAMLASRAISGIPAQIKTT